MGVRSLIISRQLSLLCPIADQELRRDKAHRPAWAICTQSRLPVVMLPSEVTEASWEVPAARTAPILLHIPAMKHTHQSEVNITHLSAEVMGVLASPRGPEPVTVAIKSAAGELLESAIPRIAIIKDGSYFQEDWEPIEENEVDLLAMLHDRLTRLPASSMKGLRPMAASKAVRAKRSSHAQSIAASRSS